MLRCSLTCLSSQDTDGLEVDIEGAHSNNPPSTSPTGTDTPYEPPLIGVNPAIALQPGETLIVYHPHSQYPMRVVPTAELNTLSEHITCHNIKTAEASYAPFPTRADFEQAELFVNNNCTDKFINSQLKLACRNGMRLEVKTSRKMHELLAHGAGEDSTDDSKVCPVHSIV